MLKLPIYLYQPRVRVFIDLAGTITGAVDKMYQYNSKIARGAKQTIQFQFLNGEQRPQDIHTSSFVFKMFDPTTNIERISSDLTVLDDGTTLSKKGVAELTLLPAHTQELFAGVYNYAVYKTGDVQGSIPAFVDGASRIQGNIELSDGLLPSFHPSLTATFTGPNVLDQNFTTGAIPVTAQPSGVFNASVYFTNFSGTLTLYGTLDNLIGPSTNWVTLATRTYTNQSATVVFTSELTGNWTNLKANYTNTQITPTRSGTVDKVLVRS
jgi:hypothetical protein